MSTKLYDISGRVKKKSRAGVSWNNRYVVVEGRKIKIYNKENSAAKLSLSLANCNVSRGDKHSKGGEKLYTFYVECSGSSSERLILAVDNEPKRDLWMKIINNNSQKINAKKLRQSTAELAIQLLSEIEEEKKKGGSLSPTEHSVSSSVTSYTRGDEIVHKSPKGKTRRVRVKLPVGGPPELRDTDRETKNDNSDASRQKDDQKRDGAKAVARRRIRDGEKTPKLLRVRMMSKMFRLDPSIKSTYGDQRKYKPHSGVPGPPLSNSAKVGVTCIGGGFSGLCYALFLKHEKPDIAIVILEESEKVSYKPGDMGLSEVTRFLMTIGVLNTPLCERLFHAKSGMSWWYVDEDDSSELDKLKPPTAMYTGIDQSFQYDRRVLETLLRYHCYKRGINLQLNCTVNVENSTFNSEMCEIKYTQHGRGRKSERRLKTRLAVDCSGWKQLIGNHLNLFDEESKTEDNMESVAFMSYFREIATIPIPDWKLPNARYICFPEGYILFSPVNTYNTSTIENVERMVKELADNDIDAQYKSRSQLNGEHQCESENILSVTICVESSRDDSPEGDARARFWHFIKKYEPLKMLFLEFLEEAPDVLEQVAGKPYLMFTSSGIPLKKVAGDGFLIVGGSSHDGNPYLGHMTHGLTYSVGNVFAAVRVTEQAFEKDNFSAKFFEDFGKRSKELQHLLAMEQAMFFRSWSHRTSTELVQRFKLSFALPNILERNSIIEKEELVACENPFKETDEFALNISNAHYLKGLRQINSILSLAVKDIGQADSKYPYRIKDSACQELRSYVESQVKSFVKNKKKYGLFEHDISRFTPYHDERLKSVKRHVPVLLFKNLKCPYDESYIHELLPLCPVCGTNTKQFALENARDKTEFRIICVPGNATTNDYANRVKTELSSNRIKARISDIKDYDYAHRLKSESFVVWVLSDAQGVFTKYFTEAFRKWMSTSCNHDEIKEGLRFTVLAFGSGDLARTICDRLEDYGAVSIAGDTTIIEEEKERDQRFSTYLSSLITTIDTWYTLDSEVVDVIPEGQYSDDDYLNDSPHDDDLDSASTTTTSSGPPSLSFSVSRGKIDDMGPSSPPITPRGISPPPISSSPNTSGNTTNKSNGFRRLPLKQPPKKPPRPILRQRPDNPAVTPRSQSKSVSVSFGAASRKRMSLPTRSHSPHRKPPAVERKRKFTFEAASILIVHGGDDSEPKLMAEELGSFLTEKRIESQIVDMKSFNFNKQLPQDSNVVFIVSTSKEGQAPKSAQNFTEWLQEGASKEKLAKMKFCVLGLGKKSTNDFCALPKLIDTTLNAKYDVQRIIGLHTFHNSDDQEGDFATWREAFLRKIRSYQSQSPRSSKSNNSRVLASQGFPPHYVEGRGVSKSVSPPVSPPGSPKPKQKRHSNPVTVTKTDTFSPGNLGSSLSTGGPQKSRSLSAFVSGSSGFPGQLQVATGNLEVESISEEDEQPSFGLWEEVLNVTKHDFIIQLDQNQKPVDCVTILYSSDDGRARSYARRARFYCCYQNYKTTICELNRYNYTNLPEEQFVIFIISHTDAHPPNAAYNFYNKWLHEQPKGALKDTKFCVVSIGRKEYPQCFSFGKILDKRLKKLEATRILKLNLLDLDSHHAENEFLLWRSCLLRQLNFMLHPGHSDLDDFKTDLIKERGDLLSEFPFELQNSLSLSCFRGRVVEDRSHAKLITALQEAVLASHSSNTPGITSALQSILDQTISSVTTSGDGYNFPSNSNLQNPTFADETRPRGHQHSLSSGGPLPSSSDPATRFRSSLPNIQPPPHPPNKNRTRTKDSQPSISLTSPYMAVVLQNTQLQREQSPRKVFKLVLRSTVQQNLRAGDCVAIFPTNRRSTVLKLATRLRIKSLDQVFQTNSSTDTEFGTPLPSNISYHQALSHYLDIESPLTPLQLSVLSRCTSEKKEQMELERLSYGCEDYENFMESQPTLLKVLEQFPSCHPKLSHIFYLLSILYPRFYSLSSSPLAHPGQIHLTIAQKDSGLCSEYLSRLIPESDHDFRYSVPIYIVPRPLFHLPDDISEHCIFVATGSGIGPIRGFWQERLHYLQKQRTCGQGRLYFGCETSADMLFEDELVTAKQMNALSNISVAFSVPNGLTVAKLLNDDQDRVWDILGNQNGFIFVAGALSTIVLVRDTLVNIAINAGEKTDLDAEGFVHKLTKNHHLRESIFNK